MVEEERLNRVKHAPEMPPRRAIEWCLQQAGCGIDDIDVIAVGFDHPRRVFRDCLKEAAKRKLTRRPSGQTLRGEYSLYRGHRVMLGRLFQCLGFGRYREADERISPRGSPIALGFRRHNDEGKVMGLAAYGDHGGEVFPFIDLESDGFPTYDRAAMFKTLQRVRRREPGESPINDYHEHAPLVCSSASSVCSSA